MDVLINSMGGILSQCICISNHHVVHFKHLTILFVNYTSIKLRERWMHFPWFMSFWSQGQLSLPCKAVIRDVGDS